MKISSKGRYGLKAMIDLAAVSKNGGCVNLKSIAARQGISAGYLEQLFYQLKCAGIVKSVRGAQGGYYLARSASEISAGDIIRALEGSLSPVDCLESGNSACGTGDCRSCSAKLVWDRISASVNYAVDSINLRELAAGVIGDGLDNE